MNKLEKFFYRNEKYGIPNLIIYIIAGQAIVYVLQLAGGGAFVDAWLTLRPSRVFQGEVWRLVSFIFVPRFGSIIGALFSFLFYYFIGTSLQREWGSMKTTCYYLCGVLLIILYSCVVSRWYGDVVYVYANTHWLNMSLFLAYAVIYPDTQLRLYFLIPVKMKWVAILDGVYMAAAAVFTTFPGNIIPLLAILAFFIFNAGRFIALFKRTRFENKNRIDFQRKTREVKLRQKERGYTHRCTVCGRTDVSDPNLEFRYCSLCRGYACYCEEHIMNHVHIE